MINFLLKNAIKKVAVKFVTDQHFRNKAHKVINNTRDLKNKGQLMRSIGRGIGRIKNKIKEDIK
tara:strand:+ start:266 stop:457 length:192 start_codon:yes stop_codon:yes gene_type:complete